MVIMNPPIHNEVIEIMNKVQTNSSCHQKYRIILLQLYRKTDFDTFWTSFEKILNVLLHESFKLKSPYVDRAIEFCSSFIASTEEYADIQPSLFQITSDFLLELQDLACDNIRHRVCQLIAKCLNHLTGFDISEELAEKIEEVMLERLEDSKPDVRFQAVSAIHRLQDASNPNCRIVLGLLVHLHDRNSNVREICVQKISIRGDTMAALCERTRDINVKVRLAAFTRASKLMKYLMIIERRKIIKNGFLDASEKVKDYVSNHLILEWLSECNFNYLQLFKAIRLDSTEKLVQETTEIVELMMKALLKHKTVNEFVEMLNISDTHLVSYEDLNWESVLIWRYLVEHLQKSDLLEPFHNRILPDLVVFVQYIQDYSKIKSVQDENSMEFQFILSELFVITQTYDLSDTVSRQALNGFITNILCTKNLSPCVVNVIIKNLERSIPNIKELEKFMGELISDIMYPMEDNIKVQDEINFKIANLKVKLNCLMEDQEIAVKEHRYEAAAKYNQEIIQLREAISEYTETLKTTGTVIKKTDTDTVLRCLNILKGLLSLPKITKLDPILQTLQNDLILPNLVHEDGRIRAKSLECYGLCCIISQESARNGVHIFCASLLMNKLEEYDMDIVIIAAKTMLDLIYLYGQSLLDTQQTEITPIMNMNQIIQSLMDLMDDENLEIQECTSYGLSTLILCGRIRSASLICRMILKWCSPASDEYVRYTIGMMLEQLPTVPDSFYELEKAVLPTIKTVFYAPDISPLSDVDIQQLMRFMLALCEVYEECDVHLNVATILCCELRDNPDVKFKRTLSKMLAMLKLKGDNVPVINELYEICHEVHDDEQNQVILSNVTKFLVYLEDLKDPVTEGA